jgi:hypothetical protein
MRIDGRSTERFWIMPMVTFNVTDEEHILLQSLAHCRGQPITAFMRDFIHRVHGATRERLDPEAAKLFDEGKLDRIGYVKACVRYQHRKAAKAEKAAAS